MSKSGHLLGSWGKNPVVWVFAIGLGIRVYSGALRCIINPDGAQYLFQASAIFNGSGSDLLACKLSYLSPLPLLIAAAFMVVRDWVAAGQLVNILLGWATLFPLYFLLRRFHDRAISTITILIFALIPFLVEGSANVIRGPLYWFCLCMGMLMFIRQWDENQSRQRLTIDLLASSLFFLVATWARIEAVVFLAATPLFLMISRGEKKIQKILIFLSPLLLMAAGVIAVTLVTGRDLLTTLRAPQVINELTQFADHFELLNDEIKQVSAQHPGIIQEFLHRVRESLALIPLAAIIYNILEGVFYPFALFFFIGFYNIRRYYRRDRRTAYLVALSLAGLVVLYVHTLQTWIMPYRFLAVLIFPGCAIMAHGVENIMGFLQNKHGLRTGTAVSIMIAFLILFGLPKSLKPEEQDKMVYRQAAQKIAREKSTGQLARVGAARATRAFEWIHLYTHRRDARLACASHFVTSVPARYDQFVELLDRSELQYFFFEERYWPEAGFDLPSAHYQNDLRLLGQWRHPDSGTIMLFEKIDH